MKQRPNFRLDDVEVTAEYPLPRRLEMDKKQTRKRPPVRKGGR